MFLAFNKKLMWLLVIWFAVLQTVSPFIHGHMGGDTPDQGHGLHIHVQASAPVTDVVHTLKTGELVHIIGVDDALVKSIDVLTLPLFAVLFVLFLFAAANSFPVSRFTPSFRLPLYLRPQSSPRAPPLL